jgi:hypothetical protein
MFNEICTLMISTLLVVFTDFTESNELQHNFGGYTFIALFSFNVLINLLMIVYTVATSAWT